MEQTLNVLEAQEKICAEVRPNLEARVGCFC